MQEPLVSCIMPTGNRRRFLEQSLKYFARQTYPNRELVIIDDGNELATDIAVGPNIFYTATARVHTVGAKRNHACEMARGKYICHWDDDDWQHPDRLRLQVEALEKGGAEVSGSSHRVLYYDIRDHRARTYKLPPNLHNTYLLGNTFMYLRSLWQARPFQDRQVGEDSLFLRQPPQLRVAEIEQPLIVGIIHGRNVAPKHLDNPVWELVPTELVERAMGDDFAFYQNAKP